MATYGSCSHGGRSSLRYSFEPHIRWRFVSSSPTQVESTLAMRSGQTVTIVGQQQLLHLSKQTLRGNDARSFELVQNWSWNRKQGKRKASKMELELNIRKEKFTFSMPTFAGKHPPLTIQLLFVDEALEISYSYWDGAGHRQVMRVILSCSTEYILMIKIGFDIILEPKVKFNESSFWKIRPHVNWRPGRSGVEGVILCLYVLSLRCLLVKGAYGCILGFPSYFDIIASFRILILTLNRLRCLLITQMVNTRQYTPEFSGLAFDEAVQRAVNALLPGLTTQITNELHQNGAGGSVDAENWIAHIKKLFEVLGCADEFKARLASYKLEGDALSWWKDVKQAKGGETYVATLPWKDFRELFFLQYFPRSEQQKYEREYHTILQRDGEPSGEFMKRFLRLAGFLGKKAGTQEEQAKNFKWALCDWILDGIVNTEFTDVAQVANAARNIEILCERSSQNNKRNRDGDRIRPMTQGNNQRGYDQKMYDGRRCNSDQKSRHNRGQQYNRSSGPSGQKVYPDYASSPPCDICGKLHPGKACYRVTGACFICGLTGHMARDCPKNGGNGGRGYGNDNQPAAKGRVFSSTKDQATNSSGLVVINHEYQNCPLRVDDKIRFANLFPMDMNDFDVILGMNSGVEGVTLCLRVLSLRCLLVKGAYGCTLGTKREAGI
ncbi:putative reverse transcriptase domain-containing protein [Tanacetum coccineum]